MTTTAIKPGLTFHSAVVNGELRKWTVQTPDNYDKSKTYPLLFAFKGQNKPDDTPDTKTPGLFKKQVNARQYIAVYPEAIDRVGIGKVNWDVKTNVDLGFFARLRDILGGQLNTSMCYFFGISTGGCFCHWLYQKGFQCEAVVTVAASRWQGLACADFSARVMQIHGRDDKTVPYSGGGAHGLTFLSAPASIEVIAHCKNNAAMPVGLADYPMAELFGFNTGDRLFTVFGGKHDVFVNYGKEINPGFDMIKFTFDFLEGKL